MWIRISAPDVALLEEEGTGLLREAERLVLDLRGVRYLDREGIALLKRRSGEPLVLRGASPFVRTVLEEEGLV